MHSLFCTSNSVTGLSWQNSTLLSSIKPSLITLVWTSTILLYPASWAFILCSLLLSFTFYAHAYLFSLTVNVLMQRHHNLTQYPAQTGTQLSDDDDGDMMVVMVAILTTKSLINLIGVLSMAVTLIGVLSMAVIPVLSSWSLIIHLFNCIHSFDSEYFWSVYYRLSPI